MIDKNGSNTYTTFTFSHVTMNSALKELGSLSEQPDLCDPALHIMGLS